MWGTASVKHLFIRVILAAAIVLGTAAHAQSPLLDAVEAWRLGDAEAAWTAVQQAVQATTDPEAWYLYGVLAHQRGAYADAVSALQRAVAGGLPAEQELGLALYADGQLAEAEDILASLPAERLGPEGRIVLGLIAIERNDLAGADELLTQVPPDDSLAPASLLLVADVRLERGEFQRARAALRETGAFNGIDDDTSREVADRWRLLRVGAETWPMGVRLLSQYDGNPAFVPRDDASAASLFPDRAVTQPAGLRVALLADSTYRHAWTRERWLEAGLAVWQDVLVWDRDWLADYDTTWLRISLGGRTDLGPVALELPLSAGQSWVGPLVGDGTRDWSSYGRDLGAAPSLIISTADLEWRLSAPLAVRDFNEPRQDVAGADGTARSLVRDGIEVAGRIGMRAAVAGDLIASAQAGRRNAWGRPNVWDARIAAADARWTGDNLLSSDDRTLRPTAQLGWSGRWYLTPFPDPEDQIVVDRDHHEQLLTGGLGLWFGVADWLDVRLDWTAQRQWSDVGVFAWRRQLATVALEAHR